MYRNTYFKMGEGLISGIQPPVGPDGKVHGTFVNCEIHPNVPLADDAILLGCAHMDEPARDVTLIFDGKRVHEYREGVFICKWSQLPEGSLFDCLSRLAMYARPWLSLKFVPLGHDSSELFS